MEELKRILHDGAHSLVVRSVGGDISTHDGMGVSDLLRMVDGQPGGLLRGARVADKVVGKAAAALMVLGGVSEAWGDVMSAPAAELLNANGVAVTHGVLVNHIENRSHTGWCPLETACRCCATAEECLVAIKAFVAAMKGKK